MRSDFAFVHPIRLLFPKSSEVCSYTWLHHTRGDSLPTVLDEIFKSYPDCTVEIFFTVCNNHNFKENS